MNKRDERSDDEPFEMKRNTNEISSFLFQVLLVNKYLKVYFKYPSKIFNCVETKAYVSGFLINIATGIFRIVWKTFTAALYEHRIKQVFKLWMPITYLQN